MQPFEHYYTIRTYRFYLLFSFILYSLIFPIYSVSQESSSIILNNDNAIEHTISNGIDALIPAGNNQGTVITTVLVKNIPFHIFYFKISRIQLVNSHTNTCIELTPSNNQINIDFSATIEYSEIISINQEFPIGSYDKAIVIANMDTSLIIPSNVTKTPFQLVDHSLNKIPEDHTDFSIEINFDHDQVLHVKKNKVHLLEFNLDFYNSTQHNFFSKKTESLIFTPQFNVNTKTPNTRFRINGLIENITEKYIEITHPYKLKSHSPERTVQYPYSKKRPDAFNNKLLNTSITDNFSSPAWAMLYGELEITEGEFSINIDDIFMLNDTSSALFYGSILKSNDDGFVVSGFYAAMGYTNQPILKKLVNKSIQLSDDYKISHYNHDRISDNDIRLTPGQTIIAKLDDITTDPKTSNIFAMPSKLLTEVSDAEESSFTIKIKPISYNNIDKTSLNFNQSFNDDLILEFNPNSYRIDQLIDLYGYQVKHDHALFLATDFNVVSPSEKLIFSILKPSVKPVSHIELLEGYRLDIQLNKDLYDNNALLKIRYPKFNTEYRGHNNISTISITPEKHKDISISVSIDHIDRNQLLIFDDVEKFFHFINPRLNSRNFSVNEIIFEGKMQDEIMEANRLSLTVIDRQKKLEHIAYDYTVDDTLKVQISEKSKNILLTSLPVLVPFCLTVGIPFVLSTTSRSFNAIRHAFTITTQRNQIKKRIEDKKMGFINTLNNTVRDTASPLIALSDIGSLKTLRPNHYFNGVKSLLNININTLNGIKRVTNHSDINQLISLHNALLSYIDSVEGSYLADNNPPPNNKSAFNAFVDASEQFETCLSNLINQSVIFSKDSAVLSAGINQYIDQLHSIFVTRGNDRLLEPSNSLTQQRFEHFITRMHDVKNIEWRFNI